MNDEVFDKAERSRLPTSVEDLQRYSQAAAGKFVTLTNATGPITKQPPQVLI